MAQLTYRQKSILILLGVLLLSVLLAVVFRPEDGYHFPEPLSTVDEGTTDLSDKAIVVDESFLINEHGAGRTSFRDKQIVIDNKFTSNLPLVVIDTYGDRPPAHVEWNDEMACFLPREGIDPYVIGTVSILDNENGTNCLSDEPVLESNVRLRRRGNSSTNYDKHQYLLKLVDEEGRPNRQNVFEMGADSEWVLNGSLIDKSQLRNYLAYALIGEIMPYTPDACFCEVIWRNDGTYTYEGLYLMIENMTVSKYRVDLPAFSENSEYLPFLLRRDRYDPNGVLLDNYSTRNKLLYGFLDIKWPGESTLSQSSIQRITDEIDRFEEALFAEDYNKFVQYRNYIDMDSFVDYFALNEYLISYDAGYNSTYIYSDYSGKLIMGPVWDFDGAMDNDRYEDAFLYTTAFHSAPWFQQMLRDPEFTRLIVERYQELRQSILSDASIQAFIDGTVEGLGSAIDRDWARWGYYYRDGNYLKKEHPGQPDRNTQTYEEEVEKLKRVLSTHGAWLDEHMDSLYQFADPNAEEPGPEPPEERSWGGALALVYISIFFVSIALVQRLEQAD